MVEKMFVVIKGVKQIAQRYGGSGDPRSGRREEIPEGCAAVAARAVDGM